MSIQEIFVNIKTYPAYHQDNIKKTKFTGLRDSRAYEKLYILKYWEFLDLLGTSDPERDKDRSLFLQSVYPYYEDIYNELTLKDSNDLIMKALKMDMVNTYISEVPSVIHPSNFNCYLFEDFEHKEGRRRYDFLYPCERPGTDSVVPVDSGTYVLIFRQDAGRRVYLRAEYQYLDDGLWHPVSTQNLSDNRKTSDGGGEHISIPANQTCHLMLSKVRLTAERIENIRQTLEHLANLKDGEFAELCHRVITIKPLVQEDLPDEKMTILNRLKDIRDEMRDEKEVDKSLYWGDTSIENILLEDGKPIMTIAIPDYEGYAAKLGERFNELYDEYFSYADESSTDKDAAEKHLKFLVSNVCNEYNCWRDIAGGSNSITANELKDGDAGLMQTITKMNLIAERLAWWIFQPAYQEVLYDYVFLHKRDEKTRDDKLNELFTVFLDKLFQIPTTESAFASFYEQAYNLYKEILMTKRGVTEGAFTDYWTKSKQEWAQNISIPDNFELLDLYHENQTKPKNYLAEVFYPNAKKVRTFSLNIMKCFTHSIITTDEGNFDIEQLPYIMKNILERIIQNDSVIIVEEYSDMSIRMENFHLNIVSLSDSRAPKDTAQKIAEALEQSALKRCIAVFDFFLAAEKLSKKQEAEHGLAFLSATIELGKAWKYIDEGAEGSFKNFVISNSKSLFDIAINVFKIKKLKDEGDHAAAALTGGAISIEIASIICAKLCIASGPISLAFFLAGLLLDILIAQYTREAIEKWVKFSYYGKDFQNIANGDYNNGWDMFYNEWISYYMRDEVNNILPIEKGIDKWIKNNIIMKDGKPITIDMRQSHIDCYYRIINDFDVMFVKVSDEGDGPSMYSADSSKMDLLRIEIKSPVLTQENVFKLNLTVSYEDPNGTRQEYNKEYILNFDNSIARLDDDGRFLFVSYIYQKPFINPLSTLFRQTRQDYHAGMDSIHTTAAYFNDHPEGVTIPSYIIDNDLFAFFNREHIEHDALYETDTKIKISKTFSGTITLHNRLEQESESKVIIIKDINNDMVDEKAWNYLIVNGRK